MEADELDVQREPRLVAADKHYNRLSAADAVQQLREDVGRCLVIACGCPCPFLAEDQCSIYPTRPNVCVALEPGSEQCQMARGEEGIALLKKDSPK